MNNILTKICKILDKELLELNAVIKNRISSNTPLLNDIIHHIQKMGGKRIRVVLLLLIGKMYNIDNKEIIKIAAAIEFIHNATLLHDDVIDNNIKRRGTHSANKIWNNKACVLAGDFLLSQAFNLISIVDHQKISILLSNSSSIIIEGEINQLIYNLGDNLEYDKYLSIIKAKTAALFSAATSVGGLFAGVNDEENKCLEDFGNYLGIAFQIVDDLLDYTGTSKILGKPIGVDYKEKKMTIPVILLKKILLEEGKEDIWNELWTKGKRSRVQLKNMIFYIEKYFITDEVMKYAEEYIVLAKESLNIIKDQEALKPFYNLLIELVDFVLKRNV